jgi:hypothetical protein
MAITTPNLITLITRLVSMIIYVILAAFFTKGYKRSVERGFANKFLLGYAIFFGCLSIYGGVSVINDVANTFLDVDLLGSLETELVTLYGLEPGPPLILERLTVALYLFGIIILMLLLAVQVYPLENMLGWKHLIGTKYLLIVTVALGLVYMPFLVNTIYPDIAFFAAIFGLVLGLVLNIGINIKIAASSTGDLRRRSISIIFASILFYVGFLLTVGIQELNPFRGMDLGPGMDNALNIMLGGVVQLIAAILYWRGLRPSE